MKEYINSDVFKRINYNNIPQSEYSELKFRNITDSSLFNENQKAILDDILDIYNKANTIEQILQENQEILEYESTYNNFKVKRLEAEIENVKEKYEALINNKPYMKKYVYPYDVEKSSTALIDNIYDCITIAPVSYEPKTYIINELDNSTFVPTDINAIVEYLNINRSLDIVDEKQNSQTHIFDGNDNTYWINKVTTNSNIKEIIASVTFDIPEDIITSRKVNELLLRPYPANSIDIINVEYKTVSGSFQQIPNYQDYCTNQTLFNINWDNDREDYELLDVDSLKFNFNDIQVNKIKITFRQKYFINNKDNTNNFVFGFKTIDARYNTYSNNFNTINFYIDFPKNKSVIFQSITPLFTNYTQIDAKKIKYDFYNVYDDNSKSKILNNTPFVCETSRLYVECKIKNSECSPNISKFEVKYKYSN